MTAPPNLRRARRIAAFLLLVSIVMAPLAAQEWSKILPDIRRQYPAVPQISTTVLSAWLTNTHRPAPLLVDARAPAEFEVSHLRGAHQAETVGEVDELLQDRRPPIVVYCSVGYRSSALAAKLLQAGHTNVFNLEGSLFAWANEGRPLVRGLATPTREVHPYNTRWGRLLNPQRPRPPALESPSPSDR